MGWLTLLQFISFSPMSLRPFAFLLAAALLTLAGCKKYSLEKETVQHFSTTYNEPITVDLYQSRDDYANSRNVWKRLTVQAGQPQSVSMEIGRKYWIDWYNADYTLTNWLSETGAFPPQPTLSPGESSETHILQSLSTGVAYARRCLLPGNAASSTWSVIGQYSGASNPLIATPFIQITFYKDFRAGVEYDSPSGGREQVSGSFLISSSHPTSTTEPFAMARVSDENQNVLALCQYNLFNTGFPYREDTFECDFMMPGGTLYYCMLVRQ